MAWLDDDMKDLRKLWRDLYPDYYQQYGRMNDEPEVDLSPFLTTQQSKELLAEVYGCPVDLVEDVVRVRMEDLSK